MSGAVYEGSSTLEEVPRQYMDFLFAGSTHSVPGGHQHQPKGYAANMEAAGMNFPVASPGGQPLPLQGPHYRPHVLVPGEPLGYGIQRSPSFQNKEAGAYANLAAKGPAVQPGASHAFPPTGGATGLYMPHPHHKQAHQMHMMGSRGQVFTSDSPPQSLITPSRNSLNVDLYDMSSPPVQQWQSSTLSRRDSLQKPGLEAPPRQHVAFLPEGPIPSRTNSFNNHQQPVAVPIRAGVPSKTEPSMPSPNTITAVTAAHILHPVKSVRVMRPEPQTAVGPSHPAWVPAPSPGVESLDSKDEHPLPLGGASAYPLDVDYGSPDLRCPPPPYPKHLLLRSKSEQYDMDSLCVGMEQSLRGSQAAEPAERSDKSHKNAKGEKVGKDKKQIQTSPVPVRKNSRDEEKRESRIKSYSPYAFKFFMEQHVENVIKTYQQKVNRRLQLEQEMAKVISNYVLIIWPWLFPKLVVGITAEFLFCFCFMHLYRK